MTEAKDYKDTVFLPKTDFPMKAGLPQKEPGILARWEEQGLYHKLREARAGREKFILHDGPPYANGDMHIGHALSSRWNVHSPSRDQQLSIGRQARRVDVSPKSDLPFGFRQKWS